MFSRKRQLQQEIERLKYRIEELEERLCPCESHNWRLIGFDLIGGTGRGDETTIYNYKCKRCGKKRSSRQSLFLQEVNTEDI